MSTTHQITNGPERIVVGVDGSESSKDALTWAARQAKLTGATLAVISAWELPSTSGLSPGWPQGFDPAADTTAALQVTVSEILGSEPGVDLTTAVVEGNAGRTLVEESKTASLIVVGSCGHGEFVGMLLGSVSELLASHSHCPVVIVRDHGGAHQAS